MSDGSGDDFSKVVDEEFCTDIEPIIEGNKKMVLEETCTQPCPGNNNKMLFIVWSFLTRPRVEKRLHLLV